MTKKFLFGSMVLATAFASCTSEVMEPAVNTEEAQNFTEIKGAKLASKGIAVETSLTGVKETRVNAQGWEKTDKIGLAWLDNGINDITAPQGTALGTLNDSKLYANTILSTEDGKSFSTLANVYEGAYFVYSPWGYVKQAGKLVFQPNAAEQKTELNTERFSMLPWISGAKFIKATAEIQKGNFTEKFQLSPVANALRVTATPQENIKTALANYYIKSLTIENATTPVFYDKVTVNAADLANETTATIEDRDAAIKNMTVLGTANNTITTTLNKDYSKLSNDANEIRVFALPTADGISAGQGKTQALSFILEVNDGTTKIGEFVIKKSATETKTNQKTIAKMELALEEPSGLDAKSLTKILRNDKDEAVALGLPIDLTTDNLKVTLFDEISNIDEWTTAINLFDALHAGETNAVADFTLDGEVIFDGAINTPATAKTVNIATTGAGKMTLKAGKVTMPSKIKGDNNMVMTVKAGAELTLDSKVPGIKYATEYVSAQKYGTLVVTEATALVPYASTAANAGITYIKESAAKMMGTPATATVPTISNDNGNIIFDVTSNWADDADGKLTQALIDTSHVTEVYVENAKLTLNANSTQPGLPYKLVAGTVEGKNITMGNVVAEGASKIAGEAVTVGAINNSNDLIIEAKNALTAGAIVNKNTLTINGKANVTTGAIDNSNAVTVNGTNINLGGINNVTDQKVTTVEINTNSTAANTTIAVGDVKNAPVAPAKAGKTNITVSNVGTANVGNLTGTKDANTTLVVNNNVTGTLN